MKDKEKILGQIFSVLAMVMYSLLFYYCLGMTGENSGPLSEEFIYFKKDSVLVNFVMLGMAFIVLYFFSKISAFFEEKRRRNILLVTVSLLAVIFGIYWVATSKTFPQGDPGLILYYARDICKGDFTQFQEGGYLAVCPHQLGMVTILLAFVKLFGANDYLAFQYFIALMLPIIFISGTKIVRFISNDSARVEFLYIFFVTTCFPMYAYIPFVYGDLCSLEMGLLAVWVLLSCLEKFKVYKLIALGLSVGIAVQMRKNIIIMVIALGIVLLIKFICASQIRWKAAAMGIAMIVGVVFFQGCIDLAYYNVKDKEADEFPVSTYIVMGLNDDYGHPGWYNGYLYNLFLENSMDAELTKQQAMKDFKAYLNLYKNNPSYMVDFFARKMNAQWNAPMYQCIVMNNYLIGEQGRLVHSIYSHGRPGRFVEKYMKIYQLVLYSSVLCFLAVRRKSWNSIEKYVLLIVVFGGFLFSLMWEAKTRYVFPYLIMQLPYMALGVNEIILLLEKRFCGRREQYQ